MTGAPWKVWGRQLDSFLILVRPAWVPCARLPSPGGIDLGIHGPVPTCPPAEHGARHASVTRAGRKTAFTCTPCVQLRSFHGCQGKLCRLVTAARVQVVLEVSFLLRLIATSSLHVSFLLLTRETHR
jgi:hypothetical protein